MPSLLLIQWLIIVFFVLIHFYLGYKRGAVKSGYFSLVSLIYTGVSILLVATLSIRNFLSEAALLEFINQNFGAQLPVEVVNYIGDPVVLNVLFAIIDLVFKLAFFYITFTVMKLIVTLLFGLLWNKVIVKKVSIASVDATTTTRTTQNRLIGGSLGAVRGFISAFIVLLPLVIVASSTETLLQSEIELLSQQQQVSLENTATSVLDPEILDILDNLSQFGENGLSLGGLGNGLFNAMYQTSINESYQFNIKDELENMTYIVNELNRMGVLDDQFDINDIDQNSVASIQNILDLAGNSQLLEYVLKDGVEALAPDLMKDFLEYDPTRNAYSEAALNELYSINWTKEWSQLGNLVEAVLTFGSVEELMAYAEDPLLILELNEEEVIQLTNILKELSELQLIKVLNLGVDYATTLDDVQSAITWLPEGEREAYLQDQLMFILSDTEYFYGAQGELYSVAELLEVVLADYGDFALREVIENFDAALLFEDDAKEFLNAVLTEIAQNDVVVELFPLIFDVVSSQLIDASDLSLIAEALNQKISDIDLNAEINIYLNIYETLLDLGGTDLLNNEDIVLLLDQLIIEHPETVKALVDQILIKSGVVRATLEEMLPALLDNYIDDPELLSLAQQLLLEGDALRFNLGEDLISLLDIVEIVYSFTTAQELLDLAENFDMVAFVDLGIRYGELTSVELSGIARALGDTNFISDLNEEDIQAILNYLDIEGVYIPENLDITKDITYVLTVLHEVGQYLNEALTRPSQIDYLDFAPLLLDRDFQALLLNPTSTLLVPNVAYSVEALLQDNVTSLFELPIALKFLNPEAPEWVSEYQKFLYALFDTVDVLHEDIEFSNSNMSKLIENYHDISLDLLTLVDTEEEMDKWLGRLDQSFIVRRLIVDVIKDQSSLLSEFIGDTTVELPSGALSDDVLKEGVLTEFVLSVVHVLQDLQVQQDLNDIGDITYILDKDVDDLIELAINLEDSSFESLANTTLLRGLTGGLVLNEGFKTFIRDIIDEALFTPSSVSMTIERNNGLLGEDELLELFLLAKRLGVTPDLMNDIEGELMPFINGLTSEQLDLILSHELIQDIVHSIISDPALHAYIADMMDEALGETLSSIAPTASMNYVAIAEGLANLTNERGVFDLEQLKPLIIGLQLLELQTFDQFDQLTNVEYLVDKWNAVYTDQYMEVALDSDILRYVVTEVISPEFLGEIAAAALNEAVGNGIALEAIDFKLSPALYDIDGLVETEHILDLVRVGFALLTLEETITPATMEELFTYERFFGKNLAVIDHILDSEILYNIIDRVTVDRDVLDEFSKVVVSLINDQIASLGLDYELGALQLSVPDEALENGSLKRDEIKVWLHAFNALNLEDFEQLTSITTLQEVNELIYQTEFLETLWQSDWLVYGFMAQLTETKNLLSLANAFESVLKGLGYDVSFNSSDFDLSLEKYAIFEANDEDVLVIKVEEVKQLVRSLVKVVSLLPDNFDLESIQTMVADMLEMGPDQQSNLSFVLQSKILLAVLDKALNINSGSQDNVLLEIINTELKPWIGRNELDLSVLDFGDITDEEGVILVEEVENLLEIITFIDFSEPLGLDTFFKLFKQDSNENGKIDYLDIFESEIILSIMTNSVTEPSVRAAFKNFLLYAFDDFVEANDFLLGFELDAEPFDLIFDALVSNNEFDYVQLTRYIAVADALGIQEAADLENLNVQLFLNTLAKDLDNMSFYGMDGLMFLASAPLTRAVLDAVIFEQLDGYRFGIETVFELLGHDVTVSESDAIFYRNQMQAFDDANGLLETQHVYDLLKALVVQDLYTLVSGEMDPVTIFVELETQPLRSSDMDRLDYLYESEILRAFFGGLADVDATWDGLVLVLNDVLEDLVRSLDRNLPFFTYTREDLNLTSVQLKAMFSETAVRQELDLVTQLELTSLEDLDALSDIQTIFERLRIVVTEEHLQNAVSIPLVHYVLSLVMVENNWHPTVGALINQLLQENELSGKLNYTYFRLDDRFIEEGRIDTEHLYDLMIAAYVLLTTNDEFSPAYLDNLMANKTINLETQPRIEYVLNSEILYYYVSRMTSSYTTKDVIASVINELVLPALPLEGLTEVSASTVYLPDVAYDDNGLLKTNEITSLIEAFNHLNLTSFNDFDDLMDVSVLYELFNNTTFIEDLMASETLWVLTSKYLQDGQILKLAADYLNELGKDFELDVQYNDLYFTNEKYGVFEYNETYEMHMIKVDEVQKLLGALTRLDYLNLEIEGNTASINELLVLLQQKGEDGVRHIDYIADSQILAAVLDRVLMTQNHFVDFRGVFAQLVQNFVDDIDELNRLVIEPELFNMSNALLDEQGVFNGLELVKLVEALDVLISPNGFNLEDFDALINLNYDEAIYESEILVSIISNVLSNDTLLEWLTEYANDLQNVITIPDGLLQIDDSVYVDGFIPAIEVKRLIEGLQLLHVFQFNDLANFNIEMFTDLVGGNEVSGVDDFDRVVESGIIYSILNNVLLAETLNQVIGDVIEETFDESISFDFTVPSVILGKTGVDSDIEVGRVTKTEWRRILEAVKAFDLDTIIERGTLSLQDISEFIEVGPNNDAFDKVLASDYLYSLIGRVFEDMNLRAQLADFIETELGFGLGKIDLSVPSDAYGTDGVEALYISKQELRTLVEIIPVLKLSLSTEVEDVLRNLKATVGQNVLNNQDDFDRLISSNYLAEKVSRLLLTDEVLEAFASDIIDTEAFKLPLFSRTIIDNFYRINDAELKALVVALDVLDVSEVDDLKLSIERLSQLSESDLLTLLNSSYLYAMLDQMLKEQTYVTIPQNIIESYGNYEGMIRKQDVIDMLKALEVLELNSVKPNNYSTFTLANYNALYEINSAFVDAYLTQLLDDIFGPLPKAAYFEANIRLSRFEMVSFYTSLLTYASNDTSKAVQSVPFDQVDSITLSQFSALVTQSSQINRRLISQMIIQSGLEIPTNAFLGSAEVDTNDIPFELSSAELSSVLSSFINLSENNFNVTVGSLLTTILNDEMTPEQAQKLLYQPSLIMYRRVASLILALDIHNDIHHPFFNAINYDENALESDLLVSEMLHVVSSMIDLELDTFAELKTLNMTQLQALTEAEVQSLIGGTNSLMYFYVASIVDTEEVAEDVTYAEQYALDETVTLSRDGSNRLSRANVISIILHEFE